VKNILLSGGRVIDPAQDLDEVGDLLIEEGRVKEIGRINPQADWEVTDCTGLVVAPGFIDMHVHLREPGREDKETILTGSQAAAAGGFTSVACMPNTQPVNDNEAITRFILERAATAGLVNVFPVGAITKGSRGEELAEIGLMFKAGIVAVSDDGHPVQNNQTMRRAMEYASIFDLPVIDHCEDRFLAAGGFVNEGAVSTRLGLRSMSRAAEELHVCRDIILSRVTKSRVHIAHVSARESLHWIREGKRQGVAVTCETAPHYFLLHEEHVRGYNTNMKMNPPLREEADVEAMLEALADGTIDCIATDHAPHTSMEKDTTFEEAANGIIGMETAIPLAWQRLVRGDIIPISRFVELYSTNPARILRLERGSLKRGAVADVTVIDPERQVSVDVNRFKSKSRNCPFHGWTLQGWPVLTMVGGRIVHKIADCGTVA
jgi:dihydroorotase